MKAEEFVWKYLLVRLYILASCFVTRLLLFASVVRTRRPASWILYRFFSLHILVPLYLLQVNQLSPL